MMVARAGSRGCEASHTSESTGSADRKAELLVEKRAGRGMCSPGGDVSMSWKRGTLQRECVGGRDELPGRAREARDGAPAGVFHFHEQHTM